MGGAIGAGKGGGVVGVVGEQVMVVGGACVARVLLAVVMATLAIPDLGSAANSCFFTDVGVGVFVGTVLVGEAVEPGVTGALDRGVGCSVVPRTEFEGRGTALPVCLGELLALPGLTGRTGKGPHVLGDGEKVPPNCGMGRRG